jgi:hypothetical protein
MPDYQKAKIYKLVNDELDLVYYGSTCQKLCKRLAGHKRDTKRDNINVSSSKLYTSGTPYIVLVENYPCNNVEELRAREKHYIKNNPCVNKALPGRKIKEWSADNPDKMKANKDKYLTKNRVKVTCECGAEVYKYCLTGHKKSQKHQNYINNN